MRNELNDIEKIERYLRKEMEQDERISFEREMQQNPSLKKSVEEQRELMKGVERMKMKKDISAAKFKYKFWKGAVNIGIPVIATTALTALILNFATKDDSIPETPNSKPATKETYTLPELNENGDSLWADADKFIPYQLFSINTSKDTVIVGKNGVVVSIPANCFVDENGNTVTGKIDFELKEALDTKTIMEGGLSTTSNGELLETGGMLYINARQNGKSLKIAEGKNIYADVPSDPDKKDMQLFDGERLADGTINWVNPKPIEKPLVPVDIHTLNFYPPLYEDSLAKMGKDVTNKKYKDSLYYSFAGRFGRDEWRTEDLKSISEISNVTKNTVDPISITTSKDCFQLSEVNSFINCIQKNGFREYNTNYIGSDDFTFSIRHYRLKKIIVFVIEIKTNNGFSVTVDESGFMWNNFKDFKILHQIKSGAYGTNCSVIRICEVDASEMNNLIKGKIEYQLTNPSSNNNRKSSFVYDFGKGTSLPENKLDSITNFSGLNPAKVKSIWNDKFQNTLIATKEFEERMPYIHKLCSRGNNVLDTYVRNINKKMCTIDSMVANTLSGNDREQFLKFAARGEGRVKTEDNCLKKLGEYYEEQTKIYIEAARKTANDYYKRNQEASESAYQKSKEQSKKEMDRINDNFKKELIINIEDAYRQIGKKPNIVNGTVRLSVGSTGWKNLDAYVLIATAKRETMNYTDPETGKKAILKYEPLSIKIKDVENYDRVLVYLLPDQLNSFMRMKKDGDGFTEKLNMLFKHELVVLAYKDDKAYFKYLDAVNANENYDISLNEIREQELNSQLNQLKKLQHADEMKKDVAHQFFLQADAKRRKVFLEKERFIRRIERVIFPCGNDIEETEFDAYILEQ